MSGRVMIVDPVSTNRIVLKVKLLAARYEVVLCVNFAEALGRLVDEKPDLILAAGADDILPKPFCDALLLAMIRGLLRSRDEARAALMSDETHTELDFAESYAGFEPAGSVAIVCDDELSGLRLNRRRARSTGATIDARRFGVAPGSSMRSGAATDPARPA